MKKLNLFLSALTVASVLSFAGCTNGNSSNTSSSVSTITTSEEKHTVTLVKNNGEANATRQIRHGKTMIEPEYTMDYYVIEGWYTDPECEKERWNFAVDEVTEDITLYAKWEVDMEDWIWRLARIASKSTIMLYVRAYNSKGALIGGGGFGSGMVIAKEVDPTDGIEYYYALTNNHVVTAQNGHNMVAFDHRVIHIYDHYQNIYEAEVLAESNKFDLALVRFDTKWEVEGVAGAFGDPGYEKGEYSIKITEFADEDPKVGLDVCSYGSPTAQQGVKTIGKITQYAGGCIYEDPNSVSCITDFDVIHHTASILQGNSGGPLFGPDLKLVGVNYGSSGSNSTYETSKDFWAVPISQVRVFLDTFVDEDASYAFVREF